MEGHWSGARAAAADVRWQLVIGGYVLAILVGLVIGLWLRGTTGWESGLAWERSLMLSMDPRLPLPLDLVFLSVPWLGTNFTLIPLIGIAAIWLVRRHGRWDMALHLIVVQVGSWTLNPILKFALGRPRPDLWELRGQFDWASYPSGHVIASISILFTAAILLHRNFGWRWPYAVAAVITAIGSYSRVYLGVHWPTDLIGGAAVGIVWLVATLWAFRPVERRTGGTFGPEMAISKE